jgi:hexosaminidase
MDMQKLITIALLLLFSVVQAQRKPIHLIPQPLEMQRLSGQFQVNKATKIVFNSVESRQLAELLAQKLRLPMGFLLKTMAGKSTDNSVELKLNTKPNGTLGKEGYSLEVLPKGVLIAANRTAGLHNGIQTLMQLFDPTIEGKTITTSILSDSYKWAIPSVKITDYPRFAWRGVMLDVSRHFFTKAEVKKYIDEIAKLKYNVFHWHLTDDNGWRIEIKSLPKLTSVGAWRVPRIGDFGNLAVPAEGEAATDGGFYTHNDIKEIVRFAQDRNITIVPEIDIPGHSMAILAAYPELSCTKEKAKVNPGSNFAEWYGNGKFKMLADNSLNPSDEKVYEFLNKVFTEVAMLFPGEYIHAGGDECYKGNWEKDAGCQELMKKNGLHDVEQLQGYFMKRVETILKNKGKKLIGWDEIVEGGLGSEAAVMSWRGVKGGIEAAKQGHNVVMTPAEFCYIDYMQGDRNFEPHVYSSLLLKTAYNFEPVPDGVDAKLILGGQANLWTEAIVTLAHAEYMTFPRSYALAEVFWSPKSMKNWDSFVPRMETQFKRAEAAGVNYATSCYDAIVKPKMKEGKLMVTLETEIPDLLIRYTLNDDVVSRYAPEYRQAIEIPEGPVTLRVNTYRNGQRIGRMLILKREDLKKRL